MKTPIWALGFGAALLALGGCSTSPVSGDAGEATRYTVNNTETFQLLDKTVQATVACTGLIESVGADGRLEVAVNVKNRDTRAQVIQVGCLFKRVPTALTGLEAPWQTVKLDAGSTETVRFKSPADDARSYAVCVRLNR